MFSGGPGDAKGQAERLLEPAGGQAPGDAALGVPLGPAELKILLSAPNDGRELDNHNAFRTAVKTRQRRKVVR